MSSEFARFVLVGLVNTAVGYAVYLLLRPLAGDQPAYAVAYGSGIILAYLLNSILVFRRSLSVGTALRYPIVYVVQYAVGALALQALVRLFGMDARWAALVAIASSMPVSFVLNRLILAAREPGHD